MGFFAKIHFFDDTDKQKPHFFDDTIVEILHFLMIQPRKLYTFSMIAQYV